MTPRFTIYPPGRYGPAPKSRFTAALNKAAKLPMSWDSADSRWTTDDESAATIMESTGAHVLDRALPGYQRSIWKATGCALEDACVIEEVMRVDTPTLDHLDRRRFTVKARQAQADLAWMRQHDPETATWYESCARGKEQW